MLIDGKEWKGYEFHFKSGKVVSIIGTVLRENDRAGFILTWGGKETYSMHTSFVEFTKCTNFVNCTSWDDPEVQEWLKEHAQKIMREEK